MSIDWIIVAAQIGNFLVLLWLLKRFLFRPILDGIDAREAEIAARMQNAVRAREESEAVEAEYRAKLETLEERHSELTDSRRRQAQEQADGLVKEARKRLEQERQTWRSQMDQDTRRFTDGLHQAGARALLSTTRKALLDLADAELEETMARHLAGQARAMAPEIRAAVGQGRAGVLTSQAPLSEASKAAFSESLASVLPDTQLTFATDASQSPGVVLRMGGAELSWTIDTYLDGLDARFEAQLAALATPSGEAR